MKKEIPLLMTSTMVQATLAGTKTQTRRIMKPQPVRVSDGHIGSGGYFACEKRGIGATELRMVPNVWLSYGCPYGTDGDRIWVREAWHVGKCHDKTKPKDIFPNVLAQGKGVTVLYDAGGWVSFGPEGREEPIYPNDQAMPDWAGKGRPSIFLPRAFSRISLDIVSIHVERLQDISEEDAKAEGAPDYQEGIDAPPEDDDQVWSYQASFRRLWESINGAGSWDANPWVWVIKFKRVQP